MVTDLRSLFQRGVVGVVYGAIAIGSIAGIAMLQRQRLAQPSQLGLPPQQLEQQEILQMTSLKYLPTKSFGFSNLLADWAFLRFLQYSGDDPARAITGYVAAPAFFDVITKQDPRFLETYLFSSGTMSYELGRPEKAIEFLQRGIDAVDPKIQAGAYRLWVLRGLDYLLLLNDPAKTLESYEKAAEWAKVSPDASDREDEKTYRRIVRFLSTDPDSTPVRYWAWSLIFDQAMAIQNLKTQTRAKQELLALGATETKDEKTGRIFFNPPAPVRPPAPKPTPAPTNQQSSAKNPGAQLKPRPLPSPKPETPDEASTSTKSPQ